MGDISNKTLALLMVAAIVVSLGGLFVSLDRLGKLSSQGGITGFVTSTATGKANVTIASTATITLTDSLINFGTCSVPAAVVSPANISSNETNTGTNCTDGSGDLNWWATDGGDSIRIRNDGNNYLNVTVNTNVSAGLFLGTAASSKLGVFYATTNGTGCMINVKSCKDNAAGTGCCDNATLNSGQNTGLGGNCTVARAWTNVTALLGSSDKLVACSNLTFGGNEKNFSFYARLEIPNDLIGLGAETKAAINFSAESQ